MTIDKVSKLVNLSKKAIRLYESRGLFKVERTENGYRSYSENDITTLSKIKLLRMIGVSLSDIKLLFDGFISLEEIIKKRKTEIVYEFGTKSEQMRMCEDYVRMYESETFQCESSLVENETESIVESDDELSVGIDIGTTTLSFSVVNITKKETLDIYNIPNKSKVISEDPHFSLQDPNVIFDKVKKLLDYIIRIYSNIKSIGITGQMHGILYLDDRGQAVSDFINWQDKRADILCEDGKSYCQKIYAATGYKISSGFGFATHYYNSLNGEVSSEAYTMCNITDFVAMRLSGNTGVEKIHSSIASSLGLYNIATVGFDMEAVKKLGMKELRLPDVTDDFIPIGDYCGIPVFVPIGDNQASFIGSVDVHSESILLNIGTGSQISAVTADKVGDIGDLEIRPLNRGKHIICGCSLSGGAAYALLESFFRHFNILMGGSDAPLYNVINSMVNTAYDNGTAPLYVDTFFGGKRNTENATGRILGITDKNFTPDALALGFVHGICRELYEFFEGRITGKKYIIASGNAVQKNPVFKMVISDMFGLPVKVSKIKEEASLGASLSAALGSGLLKDESEFSKFIKYGD